MTLRKLLIVALGAAYSAGAVAAPFCVDVSGLPQQCLFVDPNSCRAEALRQHGQCVANANELQTPPRSQAFCMVTAGRLRSRCGASQGRLHPGQQPGSEHSGPRAGRRPQQSAATLLILEARHDF